MNQRILQAALLLCLVSTLSQPLPAVDVSLVPLWDGETSATPDGLLINRYGGLPVFGGGTNMLLSHSTSQVHSGNGAYQIDIPNPINPGGFGFFQTSLAPSSSFGPGRDLRPFDEVKFWLKNDTGASFNLKFEIEDYRDTSAHLAFRDQVIQPSSTWQQYSIPLDFNAPGWHVQGSPNLERVLACLALSPKRTRGRR